MKFIIATRKSDLAQAQADKIRYLLNKKFNADSEKLLIVTEGDKRLDVTLDKIGGKGLFVKEIETALLEGKAHSAVHSMKDVPYDMPSGFKIVAMPEREDVRDALVSVNGESLMELKNGAIIGTSSIRRSCQLLKLRPDLNIVPIRGNVLTRLSKMKSENMDGIILASAGLKRLNMQNIISEYLNPEIFIPAIGQGALGIETLENLDEIKYFEALNDELVNLTVSAERSFMRALNGGCHSPIGAYAQIKNNDLYIIGTYELNNKIIVKDILGNKEDNLELGIKLAEKILKA